MPIASYTTFANGAGMTVSAIEAEFDKGIAWLERGVVVADIDDNTIAPEHVYRQETYGFPKRMTEYVAGDIGDQHHALGTVITGRPSTQGPEPTTTTIFSDKVVDGRFVIPGTARRFEVLTDTQVWATWEWHAFPKYDWDQAGNPVYPDELGYFIACYRKVNAPFTIQRPAVTRRKVHAQVPTIGGSLSNSRESQHYTTQLYFNPTQSGDWATWLEYVVVSTAEHQVYVTVRNETHSGLFR